MIDDRPRVLTWFLNLTASVVFAYSYIMYFIFSTVKVSNRLVNIVCHHTFVINGTTLVHEIHELVSKYIMEQCDVDLCFNFILKYDLFNYFHVGNVHSQTT